MLPMEEESDVKLLAAKSGLSVRVSVQSTLKHSSRLCNSSHLWLFKRSRILHTFVDAHLKNNTFALSLSSLHLERIGLAKFQLDREASRLQQLDSLRK